MAGKASRPGAKRALASTLIMMLAAGGLAGCSEGGPLSFLTHDAAVTTASATHVSGTRTSSTGETTLAYTTVAPGGGRAMVGEPYRINGHWYYPEEDPDYTAVGMASWYGSDFHGLDTANGETFNMAALTAAHPTLPLPSYARVTNLENGRSIVVRVNDRGPFAHGRLIDLSRRAATILGYENQGVAEVQVEYVGPAPLEGDDEPMLLASYREGGNAPLPVDSGLPPGVMVASASPPTPPAALPVPDTRPVMVAYAPVPARNVPSPVAAPSAVPVLAIAPVSPAAPARVISPAAFSTYFDPVGAVIATSFYTPDNRAFVSADGAHQAIEALAGSDAVSLGALPTASSP